MQKSTWKSNFLYSRKKVPKFDFKAMPELNYSLSTKISHRATKTPHRATTFFWNYCYVKVSTVDFFPIIFDGNAKCLLQKVLYFLVTKISNQKGATKNISHRTQNLKKNESISKTKILAQRTYNKCSRIKKSWLVAYACSRNEKELLKGVTAKKNL